MYFHFVNHERGHDTIRSLQAVKPECLLLNYSEEEEGYFYKYQWPIFDHIKENTRFLIDSGGFQAFSRNKKIDRNDYLRFVKEFAPKLPPNYGFFNLDVIGDQKASAENQEFFEKRGFQPIPVFTYRAQLSELEALLKKYDYVAFGGLVPLTGKRKALQSWLDYLFGFLRKNYFHDGIFPRIHLLGMTAPWILKRYPAYSVDSSTWATVGKFGETFHQIPFMPTIRDQGDPARAAKKIVMTYYLQKRIQEAEAITNQWKLKGVSFAAGEPVTGKLF